MKAPHSNSFPKGTSLGHEMGKRIIGWAGVHTKQLCKGLEESVNLYISNSSPGICDTFGVNTFWIQDFSSGSKM